MFLLNLECWQKKLAFSYCDVAVIDNDKKPKNAHIYLQLLVRREPMQRRFGHLFVFADSAQCDVSKQQENDTHSCQGNNVRPAIPVAVRYPLCFHVLLPCCTVTQISKINRNWPLAYANVAFHSQTQL